MKLQIDSAAISRTIAAIVIRSSVVVHLHASAWAARRTMLCGHFFCW